MGGDRNLWLTDRDRVMLGFMAEHRLVLERQVLALVGGSLEPVRRRLQRLAAHGYARRWNGFDGASCCAIRSRGLAAIGSRLRAPKENLGMYRHDVGTAWLWLAARRGEFGPAHEVIAEREIRSHDMMFPEAPYAVRLGGYDADGYERRHYPDLLLVDDRGRRVALELELSPKTKLVREDILAAYGADRRVDRVIYIVQADRHGRSIGRAVRTSAAGMGVSDRVEVRPMPTQEIDPAAEGGGHVHRPRDAAGPEVGL